MKLQIEQRHIDMGMQKDKRGCAIARALGEKLYSLTGRQHDIEVYPHTIVVNGRMMPTTGDVYGFVRKFDEDKSLVSPGEMMLSPFFPTVEALAEHLEYATVRPRMMYDEISAMGTPPSSMSYTMPYPKEPQWVFKQYPYSSVEFKPYSVADLA